MLELVRRSGGASVAELSAALGVSEATVRRDLRRLADAGAIVRSYGGAVPAPAAGAAAGATTERTRNGDLGVESRKDRIGKAAAELIEDGETVAISSGTTTLAVARHLVDRSDLTVITNALDVAQVLIDRSGIELIVLGGVARPRMHSLLGHLTQLTINELRADRLVMGIAAFDAERGLTNDYMPEVVTDRVLAGVCGQLMVTADSSKCGRIAPAHVFPMSRADVLVTDDGLPPDGRAAIERQGVRVVLA